MKGHIGRLPNRGVMACGFVGVDVAGRILVFRCGERIEVVHEHTSVTCHLVFSKSCWKECLLTISGQYPNVCRLSNHT